MADVNQFKIDRIKKLKSMYADEASAKRWKDETPSNIGKIKSYTTAAKVREALINGVNNVSELANASNTLYSINPIYAAVLNYLADMYMWRYKVIPHKVFTKSKAKMGKKVKDDDFNLVYNLMLEVADGLSIETKFPSLLTKLYIEGAVYFTTVSDEESLTIDTILLPTEYCRKVGETQYGTAIIQFDYSYFNNLGLQAEDLKKYMDGFPQEFKKGFSAYQKDNNKRWGYLDPHFSTGILLNDIGLPTYFYLYGGILDYEQYQDNELERNENLLKYIVVHTMPHYEDKLIFEVDEVEAIHKSLKKIVDVGDKARLITTYGDVHVDKISENETAENQVLSKAFKAIFNNAGFNSGIFTSESVEALKMSLIRDKGMVWKHVQKLMNFYNIAINNWFDFKPFQADIDILPISPYTYNDDIGVYRQNATLGVGKLDYIIASGIKQKNITDQLSVESFLKLNDITPMQTSYTQTAEDRNAGEQSETQPSSEEKTVKEIEPSETVEEKEESSESEN